ncbi:MAG: peptidylprolyl isomerase [Maricaulaceae bacterium]
MTSTPIFRNFVLSATAAFFTVTAPTIAAQTGQGIAAVVNEDIVTSYDLRQRVLFILATTGVERDEQSLLRVQNQALKNLIDEALQIQESRKFDQSINDQEVNQRVVELLSRNNVSPEEVAQRLATVGAGLGTLQNQVRSEIAWQRIVNGLFGSRIRISDAQIDENLTRLTASSSKPSYRVAEIYIEATPEIGGIDGAREGAKAMIEQLNQGAPFNLLAQQFSSSPSSARGGDVGWVNEGELREEIDSVIQTMEIGKVSTPIQVPGGIYVVALIDKRISKPDTLFRLEQIRVDVTDDVDFETAKSRLNETLPSLDSCDTLKADLKDIEDVSSIAMGEIKATAMSPAIVKALEGVEEGQISTPIPGPDVAVSFFVCEKQITGENIPTRDQIEDRLTNQQLAQASKRHLRDLRRDAAISIR